MPYFEAKLSIELDENKKDNLQKEITNIVSAVFSKPKAYIMANIETSKTLYMAEEKIEKGAFIALYALGKMSKTSCENATKQICNLLEGNYGLNPSNIYITYLPLELWGWNGTMF